MATHFHPLRISDVRRETDECVSIAFDVPPELADVFQFHAGQNLTLRINHNDAELRRSYSICSSPYDRELRVAIKKVPNGQFSAFANELLKVGDVVEVMAPSGKFYTPLQEQNKKSYLAFAAGSGITPILSIVRSTLLSEPLSDFTLVYGNRDRRSIIFREALEALKNKFMQRFQLIHILSREQLDSEINQGRINEEKIHSLSSIINYKSIDEVFVCGPEPMINAVRTTLPQLGIPSSNIHFELFHPPGQQQQVENSFTQQEDADKRSKVSIKLDGVYVNFDLRYNDASILDAALATGADLPYACKGGVCATCKAKLIEGEVQMDTNYALVQDEINAGFILTCQSHPRSENIVVDFDLR